MFERHPQASLHVALLSPCYWPEVRRGSERFVHEFAGGLRERGHEPTLITSHRGLTQRTREDGIEVIRLPRPPQQPLTVLGLESYLTHVPLSYAELRRGSYDIAHAVYPTDALAAARWARGTGRPAILSYMGVATAGHLRARRLRERVLRGAASRCDAVVVLSRHAAAEFERNLGVRAEVVAPPVDTRVFAPGPEREPRPTIICPAAVDAPHKNMGLLLDAFALVRARLPDAQLVLSRSAAALPDDAGVQSRDLDDSSVLASAYASAWTAVLPSVDEAFGLVLAEALACGTPIVGYAGGAIPEIIDRPGIGVLFDLLAPQVLAEALVAALELAHDPATGLRCRERAEEFTRDRCTAGYLALYERLRSRSGHVLA